MENDADTITPLDGDGSNVVDPGGDPNFGTGNVPPEQYEGGNTTVATRRGFVFAPNNKDLPVVTSTGTKMNREDADAVVKEAESTRAGVHIVEDEEGE